MLRARPFPETRPSLLEAVRATENDAGWNVFYQSYAPAIFRIARRRGMAAPEAEDVVQQVMMTLSKHLPTFEYQRDRAKFRTWVQRVTETKIVDTFRRRSAQMPGVGFPLLLQGDNATAREDESSREQWQREWRMQDILHCLRLCQRDIAPRTLEVFQLFAIEGRTAQEVAERMDMSINQVHVIRHQVIVRLKAQMQRLDWVH